MVFADGLRVYAPNAKAPAHVKAKLVVNAREFSAFLAGNADAEGTVRLEVRESKGGKLYACLDTYRPANGAPGDTAGARGDGAQQPAPASAVPSSDKPDDDNLPF
jgi:hypothetical protein